MHRARYIELEEIEVVEPRPLSQDWIASSSSSSSSFSDYRAELRQKIWRKRERSIGLNNNPVDCRLKI